MNNGLQFGNIGGSVTVRGDMTAGDKILQAIPGLSPERAETLRPIVEEILRERKAQQPNKPKIEGLLQTATKAGIPALIKIVTEMLLT